MPGDCVNPYVCEWGIGYLWRWMNWISRADVYVLALLFVYSAVSFLRVSRHYCLVRRRHEIDSAVWKKLSADLSTAVNNLKSIAFIAPYLGLAGTCFGIMGIFRGIAMEVHEVRAMMAAIVAASLITTAAGILVAVPATCFYNYLCTRIDLVEGGNETQRTRRFQARRLPLNKRSAGAPVFAVIAAISLAIIVAICTPFFPPREPMGLGVGLTSAGCESDLLDRVVVLRITDTGKLLLNGERQERENLAVRLSAIYSTRRHRTIYLLADDEVPFQTVADTISLVRSTPAVASASSSLDISVNLLLSRAPCSDSAVVRSTQSGPSDKTNPKHVESPTEGDVSWDPIVCWGCPTSGDVVAFFIFGLVLCAPIFVLIRRVRTRKRESAQPQRFLE